MTIQDELRSGARGMVYDPQPTDLLLVLFASRAGGLVSGVPPWGFARSSSGTDGARLFLRDHHMAWYQRGVLEQPTVTDLAAELGKLAAQYRRVRLFGASMGGYAALHYGRLLGLDALAINPQTTVDPAVRRRMRDDRWPDDLAGLYADVPADATLDLRDGPYAGGRQVIVYANQDPLDTAHALRMRLHAGIVLSPRPSGAHDLAKHLAAAGELTRVMLLPDWQALT